MDRFSSDVGHENALRNKKPQLAFDESAPFEPWKKAVREKLTQLLGDMPERVPLNLRVEWEKEYDTFLEKRISFDSEADVCVPCHLWIPKNASKPCPVVICLQGHSTGMHNSMGRQIHQKDFDNMGRGGDRDFAVQAVAQGYAALVLEQRGMGERLSPKSFIMPENTPARAVEEYNHVGCLYPAMSALLQGRTLLGERVWEVSRAIDALAEFEEIDTERVACLGNSGGGTTTYYAACMDERIKIAVASCSVCTFIESIGITAHCSCNYLPGMAKYLDMGELAACIAPRKLIVVSGREDPIFHIEGSKKAYSVIEKIYKKAGCPENCEMVIGEGGHRFYADPTWDIFNRLTGWKE